MDDLRTSELESIIWSIGSEIIEKLNRKPTFLASLAPKNLGDSLLSLAIKNPRLKKALFQFVDLLPSLKTDEEIISIFTEYLREDLATLPLPVRESLKWAERRKSFNLLSAGPIRLIVESLASRFILGSDLKVSLPAIRKLVKSGRSFSVDLLGEATLTPSEGIHFQKRYLELLDLLHGLPLEDPNRQISVKISSLVHRFDPADWNYSVQSALDRLKPIFAKAAQLNISVVIDMESYYYKDLILNIFMTLLAKAEFREKPVAGIAVQAYLKNSLNDLRKLSEWSLERNRPVFIRLVKGAYWDYEMATAQSKNWPVPVFENKWETDRNYEAALRFLIQEPHLLRPLVATHNIRSAAAAIAMNQLVGRTKDQLEIQMLYGMADPLQVILANLGHPVRIYSPVGRILPGMAYLIRRLMENSANNSILVQTFSGLPVSTDILRAPDHPASSGTAALKPRSFFNASPVDLSIESNRHRIENEIASFHRSLKQQTPYIPLIINGQKVSTDSTAFSRNPAEPAEVLGQVAQASLQNGEDAIQSALAGFGQWSRQSVETRAALLKEVARRMENRRFELMALEIMEAGKTWKEADGDICESIDFLNFYADEMVRLNNFYSAAPVDSFPGEENRLSLQPLGIVTAIPPWNFPMALSTGMVAAGLVAGNSVIFKPSSFTPMIGSKLVELFLEAGIQDGVLQFLPGKGSVIGEFLIRHPSVRLIAFTGSNEIGRHILNVASNPGPAERHYKRVIAEMGGKNAIIVDESADLDEAIQGIVESAFGYQGQKCSACSRLIVHQSVYDAVLTRLIEATGDLVRGDPRSASTLIGPVIDQSAAERIQSYIEIGLRTAKVAYLRKGEQPGFFVGPAIFEEVPVESPLAQEEIFGPVLSVFRAQSFQAALKLANDSQFALTGGVYSRKPSHLQMARETFHVGNLYLNRKITGAMVGRHPFGGFKQSGIGMKTGGPDYLLQFMQVKSISENSSRRGYIPET